MKTRLFLGVSLLSAIPFVYSAPPGQLWKLKKELIRYHDSGQYQRDIARTTRRAARYLTKRVARNTHHRLAVVFDIDETALSNFNSMKRLNFGGTLKQIKHAEIQGKDTSIKPSRALFNFARSRQVDVFFITGRRQNERRVTVRNLHQAGYRGWTKLYMKPNHYRLHSAAPFKTKVRRQLELAGYDIVFSIGDQYSDLKGGYADKTYKLVNPFYYVP